MITVATDDMYVDGSQSCEPPKLTYTVELIPLQWSDVTCTVAGLYRVSAYHALGKLQIEWAKPVNNVNTLKVIYLNGIYLGKTLSVDSAKKVASRHILRQIMALISVSIGGDVDSHNQHLKQPESDADYAPQVTFGERTVALRIATMRLGS